MTGPMDIRNIVMNYSGYVETIPSYMWHNKALCIPPLNLVKEYVAYILKLKLTCFLIIPEWNRPWITKLLNTSKV